MRNGKYGNYEFLIIKQLIEKPIVSQGLKKIFPNIEKIAFHDELCLELKIPRSSYNDVVKRLIKRSFVTKLYLHNTNYSQLLGLTKQGLLHFESVR